MVDLPEEEEEKRAPNVLLEGIDEIAKTIGRTYNTILQYSKDRNFPMSKLGGIWVAYTWDIEDWKEAQMEGVWYEKKVVTKKKKKKASKNSESK